MADYSHLSPIERSYREEQDRERADTEVGATYLACGQCGGAPAKKRGLCGTCYQQAYRGGYLNEYPIEQIYQRGWVEDMLPHILAIHGEDIIEDALAVHRFRKKSEGEGEG